MFVFKSVKEQLMVERKRREIAEAKLNKASADVDYIAMMCDVELDCEAEVLDYEQI